MESNTQDDFPAVLQEVHHNWEAVNRFVERYNGWARKCEATIKSLAEERKAFNASLLPSAMCSVCATAMTTLCCLQGTARGDESALLVGLVFLALLFAMSVVTTVQIVWTARIDSPRRKIVDYVLQLNDALCEVSDDLNRIRVSRELESRTGVLHKFKFLHDPYAPYYANLAELILHRFLAWYHYLGVISAVMMLLVMDAFVYDVPSDVLNAAMLGLALLLAVISDLNIKKLKNKLSIRSLHSITMNFFEWFQACRLRSLLKQMCLAENVPMSSFFRTENLDARNTEEFLKYVARLVETTHGIRCELNLFDLMERFSLFQDSEVSSEIISVQEDIAAIRELINKLQYFGSNLSAQVNQMTAVRNASLIPPLTTNEDTVEVEGITSESGEETNTVRDSEYSKTKIVNQIFPDQFIVGMSESEQTMRDFTKNNNDHFEEYSETSDRGETSEASLNLLNDIQTNLSVDSSRDSEVSISQIKSQSIDTAIKKDNPLKHAGSSSYKGSSNANASHDNNKIGDDIHETQTETNSLKTEVEGSYSEGSGSCFYSKGEFNEDKTIRGTGRSNPLNSRAENLGANEKVENAKKLGKSNLKKTSSEGDSITVKDQDDSKKSHVENDGNSGKYVKEKEARNSDFERKIPTEEAINAEGQTDSMNSPVEIGKSKGVNVNSLEIEKEENNLNNQIGHNSLKTDNETTTNKSRTEPYSVQEAVEDSHREKNGSSSNYKIPSENVPSGNKVTTLVNDLNKSGEGASQAESNLKIPTVKDNTQERKSTISQLMGQISTPEETRSSSHAEDSQEKKISLSQPESSQEETGSSAWTENFPEKTPSFSQPKSSQEQTGSSSQPKSSQEQTSSSSRPESSKDQTSSTSQPESSKKQTSFTSHPESSKEQTSSTSQPESSKEQTSSTSQPESSKEKTSSTSQPESSKEQTSSTSQPESSKEQTSSSSQPKSSQEQTSSSSWPESSKEQISSTSQPESSKEQTSYTSKPESSKEQTSSSSQPKSSQEQTSSSSWPESSKEQTSSTSQPESSKEQTSSTSQPESPKEQTSSTSQPESSKEQTSSTSQPESSKEQTSSTSQPESSKEQTPSFSQPKSSQEQTGSSSQPKSSQEQTSSSSRPEISKEQTSSTSQPESSKEQTSSTSQPESSKEQTSSTSQPESSKEKICSSSQPGNIQEDPGSSSRTKDSPEKTPSSSQPGNLQEETGSSSQPESSKENISSSSQPGNIQKETGSSSRTEDSPEKTPSSSQPKISKEKTCSSSQPGNIQEETGSSSQPESSKENICSSSQPGNIQEESGSSSQPESSKENICSSSQPGNIQEETGSSLQPEDSPEKTPSSSQPGNLQEETGSSAWTENSLEKTPSFLQPESSQKQTDYSSQPQSSEKRTSCSSQLKNLQEGTSSFSQPEISQQETSSFLQLENSQQLLLLENHQQPLQLENSKDISIYSEEIKNVEESIMNRRVIKPRKRLARKPFGNNTLNSFITESSFAFKEEKSKDNLNILDNENVLIQYGETVTFEGNSKLNQVKKTDQDIEQGHFNKNNENDCKLGEIEDSIAILSNNFNSNENEFLENKDNIEKNVNCVKTLSVTTPKKSQRGKLKPKKSQSLFTDKLEMKTQNPETPKISFSTSMGSNELFSKVELEVNPFQVINFNDSTSPVKSPLTSVPLNKFQSLVSDKLEIKTQNPPTPKISFSTSKDSNETFPLDEKETNLFKQVTNFNDSTSPVKSPLTSVPLNKFQSLVSDKLEIKTQNPPTHKISFSTSKDSNETFPLDEKETNLFQQGTNFNDSTSPVKSPLTLVAQNEDERNQPSLIRAEMSDKSTQCQVTAETPISTPVPVYCSYPHVPTSTHLILPWFWIQDGKLLVAKSVPYVLQNTTESLLPSLKIQTLSVGVQVTSDECPAEKISQSCKVEVTTSNQSLSQDKHHLSSSPFQSPAQTVESASSSEPNTSLLPKPDSDLTPTINFKTDYSESQTLEPNSSSKTPVHHRTGKAKCREDNKNPKIRNGGDEASDLREACGETKHYDTLYSVIKTRNASVFIKNVIKESNPGEIHALSNVRKVTSNGIETRVQESCTTLVCTSEPGRNSHPLIERTRNHEDLHTLSDEETNGANTCVQRSSSTFLCAKEPLQINYQFLKPGTQRSEGNDETEKKSPDETPNRSVVPIKSKKKRKQRKRPQAPLQYRTKNELNYSTEESDTEEQQEFQGRCSKDIPNNKSVWVSEEDDDDDGMQYNVDQEIVNDEEQIANPDQVSYIELRTDTFDLAFPKCSSFQLFLGNQFEKCPEISGSMETLSSIGERPHQNPRQDELVHQMEQITLKEEPTPQTETEQEKENLQGVAEGTVVEGGDLPDDQKFQLAVGLLNFNFRPSSLSKAEKVVYKQSPNDKRFLFRSNEETLYLKTKN